MRHGSLSSYVDLVAAVGPTHGLITASVGTTVSGGWHAAPEAGPGLSLSATLVWCRPVREKIRVDSQGFVGVGGGSVALIG